MTRTSYRGRDNCFLPQSEEARILLKPEEKVTSRRRTEKKSLGVMRNTTFNITGGRGQNILLGIFPGSEQNFFW
jgi:hypothetical protein